MKCTAIVLAAGQGKRMNSDVQKQYLQIQHHPVLYYSLKTMQECPWMTDIILVTGENEIPFCQEMIVDKYCFNKVSAIISGGKERYHSVMNGLLACKNTDYVFIHDGARPFVSQDILDRGLKSVLQNNACAAGMPSKDTVKIVNQNKQVQATPVRRYVWNVQTPQVFLYSLVLEAYEKALKSECNEITDDAMVVEQYGNHMVTLYEGAYENIKITTPEDLYIAEAFMKKLNI